jgi:hypothetical protein
MGKSSELIAFKAYRCNNFVLSPFEKFVGSLRPGPVHASILITIGLSVPR